ncbi:hypothetical protein RF11_07088 [Thelohanellus kitauei]|uniref:Uncharacterized protein n=1 Tax=Thelohanellus kitauei TaxID=669202 RepID=A0A0C2M572_THEKT|nr:hypothetical protein RF11_07088 [Thelohanellus kitauei]
MIRISSIQRLKQLRGKKYGFGHTSDDVKPSITTDVGDQNISIQDYPIPANDCFQRKIPSEVADVTTLNDGKTNTGLTPRDIFATLPENTENMDEINTILKSEGDNSPTNTLEAVQLSEMKDSKVLMDIWRWFD